MHMLHKGSAKKTGESTNYRGILPKKLVSAMLMVSLVSSSLVVSPSFNLAASANSDVSFTSTDGNSASKIAWVKVDNDWTYWKDGKQVTGWFKDGGNDWFYCDVKTGTLKTGWFQDGGSTWYYCFTQEDALQRGNKEGAMASNKWILNNDKWYYLSATGAMEKGKWVKDADDTLWSWVGEDGAFLYTYTDGIISELGLTRDSQDASKYTAKINSAVYSQLDFNDTKEAEFATRGLIDAPDQLEITDADGNVVWSQAAYSFLDDYEKAPDTVNPSLWENTKNNNVYGLFEVTKGVYQVRGYDMANLTVIASDNGWIVLDTLMSVECTQAAMSLIEKNLGSRPVKAVIISHSHSDHYGGIKGVISNEEVADKNLSIEDQIASGKIPVIVPEGFAQAAISENVYVGPAMGRRSNYQFGVPLEPGTKGSLAFGIGMDQSTGMSSYICPTYEISKTGQTLTIDGIDMEFQLTPDSEAPVEMNTWFPQFNALWVADNCVATLHNLYAIRGVEVRDGAAWAGYITEAITRYGDKVDIVMQSHNWPHWGNDVVNDYLVNTAAAYKFINDQTLTYINQGYTSDEISNMIELPSELAKNWYTRQYYGTVAHNSKAVYQKYLGWYDANPVNLNPLEPSQSAQKWVEYLGNTDDVLRMAKKDYDAGEYQWVAEVTNVLVFADPENTAARLLCANALEQLGYQSESGAWRNAYLTAALELRYGNSVASHKQSSTNSEVALEWTSKMIIDCMSILLDKQALASYDFTMNVNLIDTQEKYILRIKNGVLLVYENNWADKADVSIICPKNALLLVMSNSMESLQSASKIEGNKDLLTLFMNNLNQYDLTIADFNIIEP